MSATCCSKEAGSIPKMLPQCQTLFPIFPSFHIQQSRKKYFKVNLGNNYLYQTIYRKFIIVLITNETKYLTPRVLYRKKFVKEFTTKIL